MKKTNEKIAVDMSYFGMYGATKVMDVWSNGINDRKLIKFRGEFYFVTNTGSVYA